MSDGPYRGFVEVPPELLEQARLERLRDKADLEPELKPAVVNYPAIREFIGAFNSQERNLVYRLLNDKYVRRLTGWKMAIVDDAEFDTVKVFGYCICGGVVVTRHHYIRQLRYLGMRTWFAEYFLPVILNAPHSCFDVNNPSWRI